MLLPSPIKHSFSPSSRAMCSRMVIRSASTWQGWQKSVRPLITGMEAYFGQRLHLFLIKGADHDAVTVAADSTRAVSSMGSPRPIWLSLPDRKMRVAPQLEHPGLKGHPGAGGVLFKDHGQGLALQIVGGGGRASGCTSSGRPHPGYWRISSPDRSSSFSRSFFMRFTSLALTEGAAHNCQALVHLILGDDQRGQQPQVPARR